MTNSSRQPIILHNYQCVYCDQLILVMITVCTHSRQRRLTLHTDQYQWTATSEEPATSRLTAQIRVAAADWNSAAVAVICFSQALYSSPSMSASNINHCQTSRLYSALEPTTVSSE